MARQAIIAHTTYCRFGVAVFSDKIISGATVFSGSISATSAGFGASVTSTGQVDLPVSGEHKHTPGVTPEQWSIVVFEIF